MLAVCRKRSSGFRRVFFCVFLCLLARDEVDLSVRNSLIVLPDQGRTQSRWRFVESERAVCSFLASIFKGGAINSKAKKTYTEEI